MGDIMMGLRFRKSFRIAKGVRVNLSKSGVGASFGIPGTGISWGVSPSRGKNQDVGCLGCLGIAVIGFLALFAIGQCSSRSPNERTALSSGPTPAIVVEPSQRELTTSVSTETASVENPTGIGARVILRRPGGAGHVHVAIDQSAFEELLLALQSGNLPVFSRLSEEGRVLRIQNETIAEVLGIGPDRRFVRILDGYKQGSRGWVESKYIYNFSNQSPNTDSSPKFPESFNGPSQYDVMAREEKQEKERGKVLLLEKRVKLAEAKMRLAQNLEKAGKITGAIDFYRQVVRDFSETPQAKTAAERLGKLTPAQP